MPDRFGQIINKSSKLAFSMIFSPLSYFPVIWVWWVGEIKINANSVLLSWSWDWAWRYIHRQMSYLLVTGHIQPYVCPTDFASSIQRLFQKKEIFPNNGGQIFNYIRNAWCSPDIFGKLSDNMFTVQAGNNREKFQFQMMSEFTIYVLARQI